MFRTNALNRLNLALGDINGGSPAWSFAVSFDDDGAGVVNTVAWRGGVSPTFTRATAATTVLSNGLIGTVASGDPRSYYDPTTLEYLGYLAEGARTNICLQSEDFGTTWTDENSAESLNAAIAPDGAMTADKLIPDAASTAGRFQQSITIATDTTWTLTCFAKQGEFTNFRLYSDDSGTNTCAVSFSTATGAITTALTAGGTWVAVAADSKEFPNGWWRFRMTYTTTSAAGTRVSVWCRDTGDGTSGIYVWGAQLEAAAFASSYIPTTTVAVTRNADVLTYPTTGWLNAAAGTFMAQAQVFSVQLALSFVQVSDGTANERINNLSGNGVASIFVVDGGVTQVNLSTANSHVANDTLKLSSAYALNDFAVCLDGGTVATDTSGTLPTVTTLGVGNNNGTAQPFGPIRRVAYLPARAPNGVLQQLTA